MIADVTSVGYFLRWAFNYIQSFAADIVATITAAFDISKIDVEDQDRNQGNMLQTKLINATNAATSAYLVPMLYTQRALGSAFTGITVEAGAYIKSISMSGTPGTILESGVTGDYCNGSAISVIGYQSNAPACMTVTTNIDGVIDETYNRTLTLGGSMGLSEQYHVSILFMQPVSQARRVVR